MPTKRDICILGSFLAVFLCVVSSTTAVRAEGEDTVQEKARAAFYPYLQGPPQVPGISVGMKIDQSNASVAQDLLPPEIFQYLQAGDFTITVQETTNFLHSEAFINASIENHGRVKIGAGELKNFGAGLPFPLIDPQTPRAGEEIAWNNRFREMGDTGQFWPTIRQLSSSGTVERSTSFYAAFMYGLHRPHPDSNHGQWQKEGVFMKRYSRFLSPMDQEGTLILAYRMDKDKEPDAQWIFDPRTRRIRRTVYNPYEASGGMDFLTEDQTGFQGYIHAYEWKSLGGKVMLVPGAEKAPEPQFGGKGGWYPAHPWELRKVYVVEAIPKESSHPYSRRMLYFDAQSYWVAYGLAYDREGHHFRTTFLVPAHPDFYPYRNGVEIPLYFGESWIDYDAQRGATFMSPKSIYNEPLKESMFQTRALMRQGK